MREKIFAFLLIALVLFAFVSCNGEGNVPEEGNDNFDNVLSKDDVEAKNSLAGTWVSEENSAYSVTFSESGFALSKELKEALPNNHYLKENSSSYDIYNKYLFINKDSDYGPINPQTYDIKENTLTMNGQTFTSKSHEGLIGEWTNEQGITIIFTSKNWRWYDPNEYYGGSYDINSDNKLVLNGEYTFKRIGIVALDANGNLESIKLFYSDTGSEEGVVLKKSK